MCMSTEASFTLAATLAVAGGYCVHQAMRTDRSLLPIAVIPLVFAVQQFSEGWVWTGVECGVPALTSAAAMTYLFIALLFWPVWIPFSMLLLERSSRMRTVMRAMTWTGVFIGLGLMIPVIADPGWLVVQVHSQSIHYSIGESPIFRIFPETIWEALYLLVVSTPLLVSSVPKMIYGGVAVIASAAVTYVFFDHAFASVWCYFAALLSAYLCLLFAGLSRAGTIRVAQH